MSRKKATDQDETRCRCLPLQHSDHVGAAHIRHFQVDQKKIKPRRSRDRNALRATAGGSNPQSRRSESALKSVSRPKVVIDNENGQIAKFVSSRRCVATHRNAWVL